MGIDDFTDVQTAEDRLQIIINSIPTQYLPLPGNTSRTDRIRHAVGKMVSALTQRSDEIASMQVRIADLQVKAGQVTLENVALGDLVREVQQYVESGTSIQIGSDWVTVHWESHEFDATPDDARDLLDAVGLLSRTVQQ